MERHAQYRKRGQLAGRRGLLLGHRSAAGEQLHCASLAFSWGFFPFWVVFLFITIITIIISLLLLLVLYFTLVIKLFLSQPTSSTFFPDSPPHPTGSREGSEGVAAWCLAAE